ncbi:hypothetical protein [Rufibacter roseus]|uniref:STAS/SEC14 domain-containing protein n=1 Tax=Rufibacter roseus TaxID=1567108 RepID=A0ABW2DME7_9BACT|nr:hypothetical protein [Rufibacter roseus]
MAKIVHTEDDYAATGYDQVLEAVFLRYKRKGSSAEFRDANERIVASMRKTPTHRVHVDVREMGIVAPEDQKWVATSIIPQLAQNSPGQFVYIALVVPENVFTQLAVETVEDMSNQVGICLNRHFASEQEAKLWLAQQPQVVPSH